MTTLTEIFSGAQTFFIDPSSANNATQVMISAVDLYFKHKPSIDLNYSGVSYPGVSIFIAETMYGVPRITRQSGLFTLEGVKKVRYNDIETSSDASVPTTFRFTTPFLVDTNKEYAIIWRFDYSDQFVLWTSRQGDLLVGTNTISPGPSGSFIGTYFDFINMFIADNTTDLDQYLRNWRPISDTDLKFSVYLARYSHGGVPVSANGAIDVSLIRENRLANTVYTTNTTTFDIRFGSYEYVSYVQETSTKLAFVGGQNIYQNTVSYPGGYANSRSYVAVATTSGSTTVTAQNTLPSGSVFAWSNIFTANSLQKRIVFKSGNTINIRNVINFISNTVITVNEPLTFTNAAAQFLITPVGSISGFDKNSPFGISESFIQIANSTANSTVRFVNNTVESIAVSVGGTGYSNSDILHVIGFEAITDKIIGGYKASANLVTNSTGGVTTIYLSNTGCGFVNTTNMVTVVANSSSGNTTANTSAGSGATFTYSVGATLNTEWTGNIFKGCKIRNIDIGEFLPYLELRNPPGVNYEFKIEMPYYKVSSNVTYSNIEYYLSNTANNLTITMYSANYTESMSYTPILPSKSNEHVIRYADGSVNDKISNADSYTSLAFRLTGNITSNSDFTCTMIRGLPSVHFSKYIINNDATDEHTDSGSAWAKTITKIVSFQRPSEDIRVYLTAYKPANCDIKVYARVYKNEDPDEFDDKNWSLLEQKNTSDLSSSADTSDYVELEYGFFQYPQDRTVLAGVVATTLNSATVTGSNTLFQASLASGSVILLRQELFPDNHIVAVVNSVTSNTVLTLTEAISNSSLVVEGMKLDLITYPHQAFNNYQKDNVARYFNSTYTKFDGYDKVALKVVFLSDSPHRVPRIDDLKFVATSA